MKKLNNHRYLLVCIFTLAILIKSVAADDKSAKTYFHIINPVGQNVHIEEASALAFSHTSNSLWTVSDNKKNFVFNMSLQGKPKDSETFQIANYPYDRPDLEGVCLSGDGRYMYLVQERQLAIIKVQVPVPSTDAIIVANKRLSSMQNYSTHVLPYIGTNKNAGLEGITFHTKTNHIYALIEKVKQGNKKGPLLIKINNKLTAIVESRFLSGDTGFVGIGGDTTIDGSGIDFNRTNPSKNQFYIVSDEGQRLFLYDWDKNTATVVLDLNYKHGEGVAYDPTTKMLSIVTDGGNNKDSKLYTYKKK